MNAHAAVSADQALLVTLSNMTLEDRLATFITTDCHTTRALIDQIGQQKKSPDAVWGSLWNILQRNTVGEDIPHLLLRRVESHMCHGHDGKHTLRT